MQIHVLDLDFLDLSESIAVFVVEGPDGLALVESGPYSTFPHLREALQRHGWKPADFQHVFLSHIHFDHAGAAWAFAHAGAKIYVHPKGLPHLESPEKLYNSARMIYGDDMDRLWGAMENIPATQLYAPEHGESIQAAGLQFTAWYTPGHAVHHIAWQVQPPEGHSVLFTGDVAGVRIGTGPVMPPCPPPDIHVEDWQASIALLRELDTQHLYLTHFGLVTDKMAHLEQLEQHLLEWATWMLPKYEAGTPAEAIIPDFKNFVAAQLRTAGANDALLERYEAANPAFMSVAGLLRYWKKEKPDPFLMNAGEILNRLKGHCVLVVGDVMLDRYLTGTVNRISPEAPVPVVLQKGLEDRLGGAANVALNLKALGADPVLCSVIGTDPDGDIFKRVLPEYGLDNSGLVAMASRRTTVKTRILGNHQQMLRIDQEDVHDLIPEEEHALIARLETILKSRQVAAVILQDYNKGVLSESVIARVLQLARTHHALTAVDPKKENFFAYKGVDLFKPNLKEIRDSAPFPVDPSAESLEKSARFLQERLENRYTMITLSEKGLYLNSGNGGKIYPTTARNISDVSGAGDTVISIAALAMVAGLDDALIAILSNLAGGQVCESPGVVPVDPGLLATELYAVLA